MKQILILGFMLIFSTHLMAVKPAHAAETSSSNAVTIENSQLVNEAVVHDGGIIGKYLQKNKTIKKMTSWVQNKILKKDFSINDPVNKWLWYAIILAVASAVIWAVFGSIAGLWRIGYLLGTLLSLAATISFVYWLLLLLEVL